MLRGPRIRIRNQTYLRRSVTSLRLLSLINLTTVTPLVLARGRPRLAYTSKFYLIVHVSGCVFLDNNCCFSRRGGCNCGLPGVREIPNAWRNVMHTRRQPELEQP